MLEMEAAAVLVVAAVLLVVAVVVGGFRQMRLPPPHTPSPPWLHLLPQPPCLSQHPPRHTPLSAPAAPLRLVPD